MRIAGSIITTICGIVVIVAVFLKWYDLGSDITAWNYIDASVSDYIYCLLVLVGGILMAGSAIPAFIVSMASKGGRVAVVTLSLFSIAGASLAIVGSIWFIIDKITDTLWDQMGVSAFDVISDVIGYGVWIAIGAAILGFIFAILTASFSKGRQDW